MVCEIPGVFFSLHEWLFSTLAEDLDKLVKTELWV